MSADLDPAQWFEALGTCSCGKAATGTVRNNHNAPMEHTCTRCGVARVDKAHRARAREARKEQKQ